MRLNRSLEIIRQLVSILFLMIVLVPVVDAGAAGPLDTWAKRYTGTANTTYNSVTYADNKFMAVGGGDDGLGRVATSPDGTTWTPQSATMSGLNGITYGLGLYVAVGDIYDNANPHSRCGIYTSPDGVAWSLVSHTVYINNVQRQYTFTTFEVNDPDSVRYQPGDVYTLTDIAYGNGRFVAVGDAATLISTDGNNWERYWTPKQPSGARYQFSYVTFANGVFVAVSGGDIATSTDGITWTVRFTANTASIYLGPISYGNGRFVVADYNGGYIYSSTNGINWTETRREDWYGLAAAYAYGMFIASVDFGIVSTSVDGQSWTDYSLNGTPMTKRMNKLAGGNGTIVMVGSDTNGRGAIYQSGQIFLPLTVTVDGGGSGSVHSSPGSISCDSGKCTDTTILAGTPVDLLLSTSFGSKFTGWSGDCSGQGDCSVVLDTARSVTATFDLTTPARIYGDIPKYYQTLQSAYEKTIEGDLIQLKEGDLASGLIAATPVNIAIRGGYDDGYTTPPSNYTTIPGKLDIQAGSLVVDRIKIR